VLDAQVLGMSWPVQGVAEQHETARRFFGGQQARDSASIGMATDDRGLIVGDLLPIQTGDVFGLAHGKTDRPRGTMAALEPTYIRAHRFDVA
jgi:hypothetical protein